jgi:hypothetical protein
MSNKTEELSAALDRLNSGQTIQSNDQEISELLEVAALLRNSDLPAKPPAHILSASVEQAIAGLNAQPKRRRLPWVYSGLLGAAAALLVFFGLHGTPEIQDIAQQTMPAAVPQSNPSEKAAPANTTFSSDAKSDAKSSIPVALPEKPRSGPLQDKPAAPNAPAATPAAKPPAPVQPVPAEARAERAAPSLKSAIPPVAPKEKANTDSLVPLKLPGRTPDSITQDSADSIRQVFNAGTPQELVISQRKLPTGQKNAAMQSEQAATKSIKNDSAGTIGPNKLIVAINGQEVTLEGWQSLAELSELAKKLKP